MPKLLPIILIAAVLIAAVITVVFLADYFKKKKKREMTVEHKGGSGISAYMSEEISGVLSYERFCRDAEECIRHYSGGSFAFLRASVGNIESINTSYGWEAGNKILRKVAEVIKGSDEHCIVGRDRSKFISMLRYENEEMLNNWVKNLVDALESIGLSIPEKPKVFVHIGYYATEGKLISKTVPEMIACAKIAESDASKRVTHSSMVRYTEQLRKAADEDKELELDMRDALKKGQFAICLQPRFDMRTNIVVGAKIMSRWYHPQKGIIGSFRYIPLFAKNGFILDLDLYLLERACSILRRWVDSGRKNFRLSLSVPRVLIGSQEAMAKCVEIKNKYRIEDGLIELEFSERLVDDNINSITKVFEYFHKNGFLCAVVKFGTGRCSLRTITNLPVDTVKFASDYFEKGYLTDEEKDFIGNVILTAKEARVTTAATGVSDACVEPLRELGCNVLQGSSTENPLLVKDFEAKYF